MKVKTTNPARIKQLMLLMSKSDFIAQAQNIKIELLSIDVGFYTANYRIALISLYKWCVQVYRQKHQ